MKLSRIVVKTRENGGNNANKLFPSPCNRVIKLVIRMNKTIKRGGGEEKKCAEKKFVYITLHAQDVQVTKIDYCWSSD